MFCDVPAGLGSSELFCKDLRKPSR